MINILHITDFHYFGGSKRYEQEALTNALSKDLDGKAVDFVIFSGDLVDRGQSSHFKEAKSILLDKVSSVLTLDSKNIFICPGNHDIDRKAIPEPTGNYLRTKITKEEELEKFFTNKSSFDSALLSSNNYLKFIDAEFAPSWKTEGDIITSLFTIHRRTSQGKNIGFISINTAWACQDNSDYGNLFYPKSALEEIVNLINDRKFDIKILIMHHPFSWLAPFNAEEVEEICYKNFDVVFSGHVHINDISMHYRAKGIFCHTSPASLTYEKNANLGYCILRLDERTATDLKVERAFFNRSTSKFSTPEVINIQVPCGEEKLKEINFLRTINRKRLVESENANELLLDLDGSRCFTEMFNKPVLRTSPDVRLNNTLKIHDFDYDKLISLKETDKDDYVIYGKDKYGKTSLLKNLQIIWLGRYSSFNIFPLYIDAKEYATKVDRLDILRIFCAYFELNTAESIERIKSSKLYLLVDNYEPDSLLSAALIKFLTDYPSVSFIFTGSQTVFKTIDDTSIDGRTYKRLFIHDLSRKEIRSYTEKSSIAEATGRELVMERIITMCKELQLPANYWTISMIIYVYKESKDGARKNIFDILDLVIDKVLNKAGLVLRNSKYSFQQYKEICSVIAHDLLINQRSKEYKNTYEGILSVISSYNSKNPRIIVSPQTILNYLINCGVLVKDDASNLTFRLNGFFEYFLAYYMQGNAEFRNEVAENDEIYMSFKNEFEIYSSLVRNDITLLNTLYEKTKKYIATIKRESIEEKALATLSPGGGLIVLSDPEITYDALLKTKVEHIQELASGIKKIINKGPLSHEGADAFFDATAPLAIDASVKVKPIFDVNQRTPEIFERYISILSRVYRNSDNIQDVDKIYEIFDFILNAYSDFTFYLIDAVEKDRKEKIKEAIFDAEEEASYIYKVLSNLTPTLVQMSLNESLGHFNLENIILRKIESLKADAALDRQNNPKTPNEHQYQLFLLYFTLIDQDLTGHKTKKYLQEVSELANLGILRISVVLKLHYYLLFKAYGNPELESMLRNAAQQLHYKINGAKIDMSALNRSFANIERSGMIQHQLNEGIKAKRQNKKKTNRKKKR